MDDYKDKVYFYCITTGEYEDRNDEYLYSYKEYSKGEFGLICMGLEAELPDNLQEYDRQDAMKQRLIDDFEMYAVEALEYKV